MYVQTALSAYLVRIICGCGVYVHTCGNRQERISPRDEFSVYFVGSKRDRGKDCWAPRQALSPPLDWRTPAPVILLPIRTVATFFFLFFLASLFFSLFSLLLPSSSFPRERLLPHFPLSLLLLFLLLLLPEVSALFFSKVLVSVCHDPGLS